MHFPCLEVVDGNVMGKLSADKKLLVLKTASLEKVVPQIMNPKSVNTLRKRTQSRRKNTVKKCFIQNVKAVSLTFVWLILAKAVRSSQ